jgi:hypothetical protein
MEKDLNRALRDDHRGVLEDVLTWLILNQMKSEEVQRRLLAEQCLMNVWRKQMFLRLTLNITATQELPDAEALDLFRGRVDFSVENKLGDNGSSAETATTSFATHIEDLITKHRFLSDDDEDKKIVQRIKEDMLSQDNNTSDITLQTDENNLEAQEEQEQ